jgi:hypothetical protein
VPRDDLSASQQRASEDMKSPGPTTRLRVRDQLLHPAAIFLMFGLPAIFALAILTPPFQAPDEHQHFYRSYVLAEGRLVPESSGGHPYVTLPGSITDFVARMIGSPERYYVDRRPHVQPLRETIKASSASADVPGTVRLALAASYPPTAYAAQALGVAAARLLGLHPFGILLAARLANGCCCAALIWLALVLMPVGRWIGLWLAMLPMSLALFASASPDAMVIAGGLLLAALAQRMALPAPDRQKGSPAAYALSAVIVGVSKFAYAPLTLAAVIVRPRWTYVAIALAVTVAAVAWASKTPSVAPFPGANIHDQFVLVLARPFHFLGVLGSTIWDNRDLYWRELVGMLGLLSIPLPKGAYVVEFLGLVAAVFAGEKQPRIRLAVIVAWAGLAVLSIGVVFSAIYLVGEVYGASRIYGFQGRYLLPALPLCLCALARGGVGRLRWLGAACAAVSVFAALYVTITVYRPI